VGSNPTPRTNTEHPNFSETLTRYVVYLVSKKTLKPSTIKRKVKAIKGLLRHGVDLGDPEDFVRFLNVCIWKSGTKGIAVDSYRDYLDMLGLFEVKLPHIRREETLPFIPTEAEIDSIISALRFRVATYLLLLKETAMRPIEAWRLCWCDVDVATKNVTVNPAKYSKSRRLKIGEQLLNMLCALKRHSHGYVFSPSGNFERFSDELEHFSRNYTKQRKRVAEKLKNPRLKQICLKTFRHWKATFEYIRTKDILHVKEMLGHKNIQNTLKYIHLANAIIGNENNFVCKVAKTVGEASQLIECGFEYVCEVEGNKLFRKPKYPFFSFLSCFEQKKNGKGSLMPDICAL